MLTAEMPIPAPAMQSTLEIPKPHLVETGIAAVGKVVIGTVARDLHDIGKNLVAMMLAAPYRGMSASQVWLRAFR